MLQHVCPWTYTFQFLICQQTSNNNASQNKQINTKLLGGGRSNNWNGILSTLGSNFPHEHGMQDVACFIETNSSVTGGADKSLARPGRKQATVTDFEFHMSYL